MSCRPFIQHPVSWVLVIIFLTLLFRWLGILSEEHTLYLIVSLLMITIAIFNYLLSKTKVNLSLFDKRYEIYSNCLRALELATQDKQETVEEAFILLTGRNWHKTNILFGSEIETYFGGIRSKLAKLKVVKVELNELSGLNDQKSKERRAELAKEWGELMDFITKQPKVLPCKFKKYLNFEHIVY